MTIHSTPLAVHDGFRIQIGQNPDLYKYDFVGSWIRSIRHMEEEGAKFECALFTFQPNVSVNHALPLEYVRDHIRSHVENNPWIPGKLAHLLAFGAEFPSKQLESPISVIDESCMSYIDGYMYVPCLNIARVKERQLIRSCWHADWPSGRQVLAVRRIPS
jgi:hypothetical protein